MGGVLEVTYSPYYMLIMYWCVLEVTYPDLGIAEQSGFFRAVVGPQSTLIGTNSEMTSN